ncbi:MAG: hypothetical protein ACREBS_07700 [Nitrososphaerales archaeon]
MTHKQSDKPPNDDHTAWNLKVVRSIEQGLNNYGESVAQVVFWNFEHYYKLGRQDIPVYPEKFAQSLNTIFGACTEKIGETIVEAIGSAVPEMKLNTSLDLVAAIKEARAYYQRTGEK